MKLQLINGQFSSDEIVELVSKMIQVKIHFHEKKISNSDVEEDIKQREQKIKYLQNELQLLRDQLSEIKNKKISLSSIINFNV